LTEAQKAEKYADGAEQLRKIQRTADRNTERLRAKAERRSAAGSKGLAAEAARKPTCRKTHPQTIDEKGKTARVHAKRRSDAMAEFLAAEAARLSARRKTNPLTAEQKAEKP
jgi:hypothetical protein